MLELLSAESIFFLLLPIHVTVQLVSLSIACGLLLAILDCICKCYDHIINLQFLGLIIHIIFIYIFASTAGWLIYGSIVDIIDVTNDCIYLSKLIN